MMLAIPIGTLDLILKHDLSRFFAQHQDYAYTAYEDHMSQDFVCELEPETMFQFILQHPRYEQYVKA